MSLTLRILLLLPLLTNTQAWELESNKDEITPGSTKDVTLTCKNDFSKYSEDRFKEILIIRIVKFADGNQKTVADYVVSTDKSFQSEIDIKLNTDIKMNGLTFLQITWPTATEKTSGVYGCEIQGYALSDDFRLLKTNTRQILEKALTADDVRNIVASMTSIYSKKQSELESEIISLKSQLKNVQQKCETDVKEIKVNISKAQRQIDSTISATDELSTRVFELKKLIGNKSLPDDESCSSCKHEDCCELVYATRDECNRQFSNLTDDVNKLEKERGRSDVQIDSRLKQVEDFLKKINEEYLVLTEVVKKLNDKSPTPPSPRTPLITGPYRPTQRPPTQSPNTENPITESSKWPDGTYALVRPHSGCPNFASTRVLNYFHFFVPSADADLTYVKLPQFRLQSALDHETVEFCLKVQEQETPGTSRNWPQGSYCIDQYRGSCPVNFQAGRITQRVRSGAQDIGYFSLPYCCRKDGRPDKPVELPSGKPFYLYRYQGTCQEVQGMKTRPDFIKVDILAGSEPPSTSLTPITPDTTQQDYPIEMCYYRPSMNV